MKRKIISLIIMITLAFLCFALTAVAAVGENYDRSDISCGGCSYTGCLYCDAYDKGYNDGVLDGQKTGFIEGGNYYEQNILPGAIDAAIADYKDSEEFKQEFNAALSVALEEYYEEFYQALADTRSEAIEEYKNSQEFIDLKDEQYAAGEAAGLEAGLQQGEYLAAAKHYEMGYADGKQSFITAPEYEEQLQKSANYGYEYGYQDGLQDGSNRKNNDGSLLKIILSVMISLAVVILLFIVLSLIIKKVKRKKKK